MRINEHNLDSLRKLIRDLQQENESLKTLLSEHNIPYEDRNVLEEQSVPDEYDEDQGARMHTARLSGRFCAAQWPDCANSGRLVKKILCRERLFT